MIWPQMGTDDGDFMNMVMNIQFCKLWGNFLTIQGTVGFINTSMLHAVGWLGGWLVSDNSFTLRWLRYHSPVSYCATQQQCKNTHTHI